MKCLRIDYSYYLFPDEFDSVEEFVDYLNSGAPNFIRLSQFIEDNCIYPYFIEEDVQEVFLNIRMAAGIAVEEVTVLPRQEYERRLNECMQTVCKDCVYREEDKYSQEMWMKLCLDGTCACRETAEE